MSALWNRNISMIHCFGDSLTEGYGVLPGQGWVALANQGLKGISLYNHGVCGSLCSDILDSLSAASGRVRKGEGFFFMGGTNDILFGIRLVVLENMVDKKLSALAGRIPLTLGIPPLFTEMSVETGWQEAGSFKRNRRDLLEYQKFLRALAKNLGIRVMDFTKAFPPEEKWYTDGIHPNREGYEKMALLAVKMWSGGNGK
ncbi:GDSL-type esterase/lipase family protein [uncultured Dialister sp.]|mgnify:FL=1|uniref:SGNH/GDSL hydrolase family protein n=1 Tax=uncultured Dialister sp. TaxID=278064 RepID=UPI002604DCD8|nr:GDSL-type esterase/lipase family protein [uncultured Dialister sp.]